MDLCPIYIFYERVGLESYRHTTKINVANTLFNLHIQAIKDDIPEEFFCGLTQTPNYQAKLIAVRKIMKNESRNICIHELYSLNFQL